MSVQRYETFTDFWPFYLGEHSLPGTRWLHFAGTTVALLNLLAAIATQTPWYVLTALVSGYSFAWVSHFFIEKNKPATFTYPLWSFAAFWKMWAFMWRRKLGAELERHGIRPRGAGASASAS